MSLRRGQCAGLARNQKRAGPMLVVKITRLVPTWVMAVPDPNPVIRRRSADARKPTIPLRCAIRLELGRVWTALRWQGVFEVLQSAGRGGHVSGLSMRHCCAPLAMMPFARTGSRPKARARSATAQYGFSRSGGFNRLCASTPRCPFQPRQRGGPREALTPPSAAVPDSARR